MDSHAIPNYNALARQYLSLKKKYQQVYFELQKEKESNKRLQKKIIELSAKNCASGELSEKIQETDELDNQICEVVGKKMARENILLRKQMDQLKRQSTNVVEAPHKMPNETEKHIVVGDVEEFEVVALLSHRGRKPNREFLVQWKGYTTNEASWESQQNLSCPSILKKYLKKNRLA